MSEVYPRFFIQVPAFLNGHGLNSTDKLIYGAIYTIINTNGQCFKSNAALAKEAEVVKGSVANSLTKLKDKGFIITDRKYKDGTREVIRRDILLSDEWKKSEDELTPPSQINEGVFTNKLKGIHKKVKESRLTSRLISNTTTTAACLNFYKENIGNLPPIVSQQIQQYCNNMSPELVKEAIIRSVESGKSWRNAKGILESWQLKKVATLDDVKQDDDNFAKRKQPKPRVNYGRPTINKKIPESMKEKYDPEKDKLSPEQKAETERMLAEFQRSAEND